MFVMYTCRSGQTGPVEHLETDTCVYQQEFYGLPFQTKSLSLDSGIRGLQQEQFENCFSSCDM